MPFWGAAVIFVLAVAGFVIGALRLRQRRGLRASCMIACGLLAAVTIVLMAAVVYLVVKKIVRHPLGLTSAMLVLGGGAGNMIDRLCRGYVVDMFDLQLFSYPVFNLADCCVVVGAILGGIYYLFLYEKYDKKKKEPDHAHDPSDPS